MGQALVEQELRSIIVKYWGLLCTAYGYLLLVCVGERTVSNLFLIFLYSFVCIVWIVSFVVVWIVSCVVVSINVYAI